MALIDSVMAAALAGSPRVPVWAWKTICAPPPAWAGKVRFRRLAACCDSTPGTLKVSWNCPPAALPTNARASTATNQAATTSLRCRAAPRPNR